jgi:integrase
LEAYHRCLEGIRATARGEHPIKPEDPYLLRDVATVLLDCGLRPEECYRLRWDHVRDNTLHIPFGKTANARRSIPLPKRAAMLLGLRKSGAASEWVFPAPTKSGQMEQSTLVKQHGKACDLSGIERLPFYTFRHTCLTRWALHMDPYTLAYFAGHSNFGTTRRYVHPNLDTGRSGDGKGTRGPGWAQEWAQCRNGRCRSGRAGNR